MPTSFHKKYNFSDNWEYEGLKVQVLKSREHKNFSKIRLWNSTSSGSVPRMKMLIYWYKNILQWSLNFFIRILYLKTKRQQEIKYTRCTQNSQNQNYNKE
jgi:hypothetical protein